MPRLPCPAVLLAAALAASTPTSATEGPVARTTQEVLDASRPDDWRRPDPASTLYLDLDGGRVVIELAPAFAPAHVDNIRTLAREGFWNGTAVYRSHDNFVVQFGDPHADDPQRARPLGGALAHLPAEFERDAGGLDFHALPDRDGYAAFLAGLAKRRITLDDASNDQNDPTTGTVDEPYTFPTPGLSTTDRFRGGDTITGLTGVMEYGFGGWRLRPVVGQRQE